ncbi:response regulator [Pseudonocardia nigra]|uniref:response regulator n=1 Tax=Pseudonocardia nigra TaxID=1921578 RepID=UPI001C5E5AAB|nr:response regulator transcription factor [Pseudonocardia nigra]
MIAQRPIVLIVDDHVLVSNALAMALRSRGLTAAAVAPDQLRERLAEPAPPGSLVLLDLDLGTETDGADLVPRLRRAGWRVLLVTGATDETRVAVAIAGGAVGRVRKTAPFDELVDTAVRAAEGRSLLTEAERRRLHAVAAAAEQDVRQREDRWQRLTPRERQIVDRIAAGRRPAAIAEEFVVSVATVRTQIKSILGKLGVGSQLEIAAFARRRAGGTR